MGAFVADKNFNIIIIIITYISYVEFYRQVNIVRKHETI
jgi:hypothetical protein